MKGKTFVLRHEVFRDRQAKTKRVFLLKMVYCGKVQCGRCPHGPFVYERSKSRYTRSGMREKYVGAEKSQKVQTLFHELGEASGECRVCGSIAKT